MSEIRKKHHPTGSLAGRVLLVCLLLLVIPLFLQNIFSYLKDYQEELSKAEQVMDILAEERIGLIDHLIEMEWGILETASLDVARHAERWNIQEIPLPKGAGDRFAVMSPRQEALLVGIKGPSGNSYAIATPFQKMIAQLVADQDSPYPIRMAIVDPKGKVWAENMKPRETSHDKLLMVKKEIKNTGWTLILTIPKI